MTFCSYPPINYLVFKNKSVDKRMQKIFEKFAVVEVLGFGECKFETKSQENEI